MNILILGGTGFLGRHIVETALSKGHSLTLFNRGISEVNLFPQVETIVGDRNISHDALRNREWDAVIDTNARMPKVARSAARLLSAATGHYTFISSISAYSNSQPAPSTGTMPAPGDENAMLASLDQCDLDNCELRTYGARKALCEHWIAEETQHCLLVIRPGLIVGPYDSSDRFTYWPLRLHEGGDVLAPGDGNDAVRFIDVRNLAEWTLKMIEEEIHGTYNAFGPREPLTMKDLLNACRETCTSNASLVWANSEFLKENNVSAWWDMPVWAPGLQPMSAQKAINAGLTFNPLAKTIKDTLDWAIGANLTRPLKAGLDHTKERTLIESYLK